MNILGFEIRRAVTAKTKALQSVGSGSGSWRTILDWRPGAFQQDEPLQDTHENLLTNAAIFACVSLPSTDVAKLRLQVLLQRNGFAQAQGEILRTPNSYQTRFEFFESWMNSRLIFGNAYILKSRAPSGNVQNLNVLNPALVDTLVSDSGDVFYRLRSDKLNGIAATEITIPSSEIIHNRMNTFNHPLVGISPLRAAAWAGTTGNRIGKNSAAFFKNMSRPSGIITAPGHIADDTAARLKAAWDANFGGINIGKVAVLGDDLKYQAMATNAADAQLVEQLNFSALDVCRAFRIPANLIGAGPTPNGMSNVESLTALYYSTCLQGHIESIESSLDTGLELSSEERVQFDLAGLLRTDTKTRFESYSAGVLGAWLSPNEARAREGLPPVAGGDSPLAQMQNFSLSALAKRDAKEDPFATAPAQQKQRRISRNRMITK